MSLNCATRHDAPSREVPWVAQANKIARPYLTGSVSTENIDAWRRLFSLPGYQAHFLPPEEETLRATLPGSRKGIAALMLSASGIAVQQKDVQERILAQLDEVLDRGEGLVWIDKEKGEFEQPNVTNVIVMRKKD